MQLGSESLWRRMARCVICLLPREFFVVLICYDQGAYISWMRRPLEVPSSVYESKTLSLSLWFGKMSYFTQTKQRLFEAEVEPKLWFTSSAHHSAKLIIWILPGPKFICKDSPILSLFWEEESVINGVGVSNCFVSQMRPEFNFRYNCSGSANLLVQIQLKSGLTYSVIRVYDSPERSLWRSTRSKVIYIAVLCYFI